LLEFELITYAATVSAQSQVVASRNHESKASCAVLNGSLHSIPLLQGHKLWLDLRKSEALPQPNNGRHNLAAVALLYNGADKTLVHFQLVEGKRLQVAQARIAGAEIVQCKLTARIPESELSDFLRSVTNPLKSHLDCEYMSGASLLSDLRLIVRSVFRKWSNKGMEEVVDSMRINANRDTGATLWTGLKSARIVTMGTRGSDQVKGAKQWNPHEFWGSAILDKVCKTFTHGRFGWGRADTR
jgi:hypothetical protein